MTDVTTQPSTENDGGSDKDLLPQEKLKRFFMGVPILSLIVGSILLIAEVTIIVLVLVAPGTVGISEDLQLTRTQRGVLGGISVLMVIEAVVLGVVDIGI